MHRQGQPYSPTQVPVLIEATDSSVIGRPIGLPMLVEFAPGLRFRLRPGQNHLALPPGYYHARLWSQYTFWHVGKATLDIDTTRGPVRFFYAAPHTIYHSGAAGFHPQERPGGSWRTAYYLLALLGLVLSLILLFVVLTHF